MNDDRPRSAVTDVVVAVAIAAGVKLVETLVERALKRKRRKKTSPVEPREAVTPGTQERQSGLDGGTHEKP